MIGANARGVIGSTCTGAISDGRRTNDGQSDLEVRMFLPKLDPEAIPAGRSALPKCVARAPSRACQPVLLDPIAFQSPAVQACMRVLLALLLLLPAAVAAQTDVIRGKVTNYEGLPLAQVRVTATSIPGNVTREARTNDQGSFQISFPGGPGDYIMGYARIGYLFRQFEVKRIADEDVLIADARLNVITLDTIVTTSSVQQRVNRNE